MPRGCAVREARARRRSGIDEFLRRKYGWQKRLLDRFNGSDAGWATIEIVDA
ncbi:MAG: hypothetical protein ACJ74B_00175 [Gaiellaceae bacterium]